MDLFFEGARVLFCLKKAFTYIKSVLRFLLLLFVKYLGRFFYSFSPEWIGQGPSSQDLQEVRVIIFLNHTSLMDAIFLCAFPNRLLWRMACHMLAPVADKTLRRAWIGALFRALAPHVLPVTRKRDATWEHFVDKAFEKALICIAPEGRMKRPGGLDIYGKPMTVRGGIFQLLETMETGKLLFIYSAGMHHIQAPGGGLPRLFKRVSYAMELCGVRDYKRNLSQEAMFSKEKVIADLERRRDRHCPMEPVS